MEPPARVEPNPGQRGIGGQSIGSMRLKTALYGAVVLGLGGWAWWDASRRADPDEDLRNILRSELNGLRWSQPPAEPMPSVTPSALERWHTRIALNEGFSLRGQGFPEMAFGEVRDLMTRRGFEILASPSAVGRPWNSIASTEPVLEAREHGRLRLIGLRSGDIVDPTINQKEK